MVKIILITFIFSQTFIYANDNANVTCQRIHEIKDDTGFVKTTSSFIDTIKSIFKSHYAKVHSQKVMVDDNKIVSLDNYGEKSYIFLFKPNIKEHEYQTALSYVEQEQNKLETLQDNLKELYNTKSISECVSIYNQYPVTEKEFNETSKKIKSNKIVYDMQAYQQASKQIDKVASRVGLSQSWYKVHKLDINLLRKKLIDPQTKNIVIVAHSDANGMIRDSSGRIISNNVFKDLSPSIQSITFYNCFSEKTRRAYNIEEILKNSKSIYKNRSFYSVGDTSIKDETPVIAFGRYLKTVDSHITRQSRSNTREEIVSSVNSYKIRNCHIALESNDINRTFVFYLNNKFIGQVEYGQKSYSFPCTYLKEINKLRITNNTFDKAEDNIYINIDTKEYEVIDEKPYFFKDSLDSKTYTFVYESP